MGIYIYILYTYIYIYIFHYSPIKALNPHGLWVDFGISGTYSPKKALKVLAASIPASNWTKP